MVRVKICGITNIDDAIHAVECGADELGFNFYAKSSRYIDLGAAKEIIGKLPPSISKVGVFVNMSIENVLEIAKLTGLTGIQLHGNEDHKTVRALHLQTDLYMIKAVRTSDELMIHNLLDYAVHAILIDSGSAESPYGGSGKLADIDKAKEICDVMPCDIYLAGGLTPDNVASAVNAIRPYAVDVASGVEASPGRKDPKKVEEFIRNAKNA